MRGRQPGTRRQQATLQQHRWNGMGGWAAKVSCLSQSHFADVAGWGEGRLRAGVGTGKNVEGMLKMPGTDHRPNATRSHSGAISYLSKCMNACDECSHLNDVRQIVIVPPMTSRCTIIEFLCYVTVGLPRVGYFTFPLCSLCSRLRCVQWWLHGASQRPVCAQWRAGWAHWQVGGGTELGLILKCTVKFDQ